MPMWASWIIVTSFAPSPIANVIGIGTSCFLISATTCGSAAVSERMTDWRS
jgi:hypothetical protein